jgi:hypothetical protein
MDVVGGPSRTFTVTVNQPLNVSWLINGTQIQNAATTGANNQSTYTNTSPALGTWNVSAIAQKAGDGSVMQTWIWNVNMAPVATFNISGFKINGTNNNGSGLMGWNISLICTVCGSVIATTTTDSQGFYKFSNLQNGTYIVSEEIQSGWTNNTPMSQQVIISGGDQTNVNFTNSLIPRPTFSISGFKLKSIDNSGVSGWTINLTNATTGAMLATDTTGSDGMYQFTSLVNDTYNVTEGTMSGWTPAGPTTLTVPISGADVTNKNFTNNPPVKGSISGYKIEDLNGNEEWDDGEKGLPGWTIELKGIGAGNYRIEKETITDVNGFYRFDNLPAGKYLVKEKLMKGYIPTSRPVIIVSLPDGENSENNSFMNRPIRSLIPKINE